jgi:hypothetical protein
MTIFGFKIEVLGSGSKAFVAQKEIPGGGYSRIVGGSRLLLWEKKGVGI